MSKEQKLIDELQEYLDIEDTSRIDLYPEEVQMCIDAIEKQIAKKPKGNYCPSCNEKVQINYDITYCLECGQKLDWSEVE